MVRQVLLGGQALCIMLGIREESPIFIPILQMETLRQV